MQVLLRRRRQDIAIWKTLGFSQPDLHLIFTFEAALLGLGGSVAGALSGVLVSTGLLEVFRQTSSLLYSWKFSFTPPLIGVLVGTLTTVIFASWAILLSSQAQPMDLFRNEPVDVRRLPGCQSVLLGALLAIPFISVSALVMKSLLEAVAMLILTGIGIAILAAFFSALLWLCTRLFTLKRFPLLRMAFVSLRRRGMALVFAMIALFVGVVSMSLGLAVVQFRTMKTTGLPLMSHSGNLEVLATANQERIVRQTIRAQEPEHVVASYRAELAGLAADNLADDTVSGVEAVLIRVTDPQGYLLSGAGWGSQPEGVYAPKGANLPAGSQVQAYFPDGRVETFRVIGSYRVDPESLDIFPPTGLLMSAEALTSAARPDAIAFTVQVAPADLSQMTRALGSALPQATVVNLEAYAARFMQSYQKLYVLPVAVAGLALLAGFLLVANSVSLAMLDRRYEIGILKAMGYARSQIIWVYVAEFGLVGLLATVTGVTVIQSMLAILALSAHLSIAVLLLSFPALLLIGFCGIVMTSLTVVGVTWQPTGISPLVVLNEGN